MTRFDRRLLQATATSVGFVCLLAIAVLSREQERLDPMAPAQLPAGAYVSNAVTPAIPVNTGIIDLSSALMEGRVRLVRASGNGSSSGSAVDAVVEMDGETEQRFDVLLSKPLYLRNRGSAQNMIATEAYLDRGSYFKEGARRYITLKPGVETRLSFVAYCADFERANPTAADRFFIDRVPQDLVPVLMRIHQAARADPHKDITAAAQAAIWMARGHSGSVIRERFELTASDEQFARNLVN
jgi:hypothetical protein